MGKKTGIIMLLTSAVLIFSGCVTRLGSFSVISTKNIDWSRASEFKRDQKRVEGADTLHIIILIPTKFNISMDDAVDNALEKVPGAIALIDAAMSTKMFYLPYVYGFSSYIIEGSLLIDPSLVASGDELTGSYLALLPKGNDFELKSLSEYEYNRLKSSSFN